jgi:16S rRNA (uracil1498-N3)-methyltransferase
MECLYLPEFNESHSSFQVPDEERKHLKALRIRNDEEIMVANGNGLVAFGKINYDDKWNAIFHAISKSEDYGELSSEFSLFVCNLHHKERLEFIVEKATELGAKKLYIPICKYSQTDKVDLNRYRKLAVTALKQSKRSRLLQIEIIEDNSKLNDLFNQYKNVLLLDENGENPLMNKLMGDTLILVGPEGGFQDKELDFFNSIPNLTKWNLGKRRLRTETAVLKALSILTTMNE